MKALATILLETTGSDTPSSLPAPAANLILDTLLNESLIPLRENVAKVDPETYRWMTQIVYDWPSNLQQDLLVILIPRLEEWDETLGWNLPLHLRANQAEPLGRSFWVGLLGDLLGKKTPMEPPSIGKLLRWYATADRLTEYYYPLNSLVIYLKAYAKRGGMIDGEMANICTIISKKISQDNSMNKKVLGWSNYLKELVGLETKPEFPLRPGPGFGWTDNALVDLRGLESNKQTAWREILNYCKLSESSKPSPKWLAAGQKLIQALSETEFKTTVARWLTWEPKIAVSPADAAPMENPEVLKGLVWLCALYGDKEIARAVGMLGLKSYQKIPNLGPRSISIGNACIQALSLMPEREGLGQLGLMKVKIKFTSAQKTLEKAISAAAERLSMTPDDLMELGVPTYGMTEVGHLSLVAGDFTAELTLPTTKTISIIWKHLSGKTQESVPASVKADFPAVLKELKNTEKELRKMLPAHVERVDQLYLAQKSWPIDAWKDRYLNHPLMGVIARRLIWRFTHEGTAQDGLWLNGKLTDRHGHTLPLPSEAIVALWHPLDSQTAEILAWRMWLEENEIRQPFKQAHREIYLLTPAEENTGNYSNRFAAHILKQHQFHALAGQRGWKNLLQIRNVDCGAYRTHKMLPAWDLRAEYWVEGAGDNTTEAGAYLYVSTDQVRFFNGDSHEPLPLAAINPLVFSEIMRDIDLFVGVASVGNDPGWINGGNLHLHNDYWQGYAFGDLSETALTRKTQLERLIPRLKIAPKCSFSDKFLVVQGQIRKYKIHLGSGNILMAPEDRYLCIVKGYQNKDANPDDLFLPYEGDSVLAVILSKAFMLVADDKIKDPSIVKQIQAGR